MSLETINRSSEASRRAMTSRDLFAVLLLGLWVPYALWSYWNVMPQDLSAVYVAGWFWNHGQPDLIYAYPDGFFGGQADSWDAVTSAIAGPDFFAFPYVYPPLWAILAAPLTEILGIRGFSNAMLLVQVPLLAASVLLAGRLARPAGMPMAAWVATGVILLLASVQAHLALLQNQPTITVTFLILLAFVCLEDERPVAAGAALALAAAIKLTPAAFALIFLLDRQYRALLAFALVGGALGLLSLALAGVDLHLAFLATTQAIREQALVNAVNISVLPALMTLGALLGLHPPFDAQSTFAVLAPVPDWLLVGISLSAAVIVIAFLAVLRRCSGPVRRVAGVFALSLVLALFGPLGWLHYYLLPLLLMPGLFGLMSRRAATLCAIAVAIVSLRPFFVQIQWLPWPVANYLWLSAAAWLVVLATLYRSVLRLR